VLATKGDAASFNVEAGTRFPLEATYCQRILRGELPSAMPDVRGFPAAAALRVTETARIGAYVSVPICLSDGTLYGTLCAANHETVTRVGERDLQFLSVVARMVAGELERDAALRAQLALRVQAAGAEALLSAIEARDRYTGAHSRNVVELVIAVARSRHPRRARALGRHGLPRWVGGRRDPNRKPDRLRLRRLGRHDLRPPYRRRMARDGAIAELATGAASQFSDVCVQALFAVLARG